MTEDHITATLQRFLVEIERRGMALTGDGRVSEANAAQLLSLSPKYLAQLRSEGKGPRCCLRPAGKGSRLSYFVGDMARWVAAGFDSANSS